MQAARAVHYDLTEDTLAAALEDFKQLLLNPSPQRAAPPPGFN
jgi:hypothetical protein